MSYKTKLLFTTEAFFYYYHKAIKVMFGWQTNGMLHPTKLLEVFFKNILIRVKEARVKWPPPNVLNPLELGDREIMSNCKSLILPCQRNRRKKTISCAACGSIRSGQIMTTCYDFQSSLSSQESLSNGNLLLSYKETRHQEPALRNQTCLWKPTWPTSMPSVLWRLLHNV